ncbi:MAG: PEFG-CTERM sorting domain-containing protein [Thaumarchaeota archaeon]|nr:PEFG-CTERM sorting domain-containing protein [Nitrososphaerota archaeon]
MNIFSSLFLVVVFTVTLSFSNSFAQESQTITLATDKASYLPGDTVELKGTISGQPGQLVAIQVKDLTGNLIIIRTIQTDQNGNFVLQFKIPTTATSGEFNIVASAKINGSVVTQTNAITATVPEFGPVVPVVLVISILSIILLSFKTRVLTTF